jgi:hypothetical protein
MHHEDILEIPKTKPIKTLLPPNFKYYASCQDFERPKKCTRPIRKGQPTSAGNCCKYWRISPYLRGNVGSEVNEPPKAD